MKINTRFSPDSAPIFFRVAAPRQFRAIIEAAVNALTIKNLFLVVLQTIMVSQFVFGMRFIHDHN